MTHRPSNLYQEALLLAQELLPTLGKATTDKAKQRAYNATWRAKRGGKVGCGTGHNNRKAVIPPCAAGCGKPCKSRKHKTCGSEACIAARKLQGACDGLGNGCKP